MQKQDPTQNPLLIITGPTGVGKTRIAVELAEAIGGEIVGADAYQVYRGMPVLTAQPEESILDRAPHHLIGCISPKESFDAGAYAALAEKTIAEIRSRNKIPIVVGGTGLYIKALTHGLSETPRTDPALREELEAQPLEDLLAQLTERDPLMAQNVDRKNKRRVQRALEICIQSGEPASALREAWEKPSRPCRGVVLIRDRDALYERINSNIDCMPDNDVMEEIRELKAVGPTARKAIGYEDGLLHLASKLTLDEWIRRTQVTTRRYAKRQLTWFKNQTNFPVLNLSALSNIQGLLASALKVPSSLAE